LGRKHRVRHAGRGTVSRRTTTTITTTTTTGCVCVGNAASPGSAGHQVDWFQPDGGFAQTHPALVDLEPQCSCGELTVDLNPGDPLPTGLSTTDPVAARWTANLQISSAGDYRFQVTSVEKAWLYVDDIRYDATPAIENPNSGTTMSSNFIAFTAGSSIALKLELYASAASNAQMQLQYSGPDTSNAFQAIPSTKVLQRDPHERPVISIDPLITYVVHNEMWSPADGVTCRDSSGTPLSISFDASQTSTTVIGGPYTVTYTCEDSLSFTSTMDRTFFVRGLPTITLNGPAEVRLRQGVPYVELGACCTDSEGKAVSMDSPASSVNVNVAGQYPLVWFCTDTYTQRYTTAQRNVIVDSPPSMIRFGTSVTKTTRGVNYVDAGVVCTDREDGLIVQIGGDVVDEQIPILSIEVFPGAVGDSNDAIDGQESVSVCASACFTFQDQIVFDLGSTRTIHEVRIYHPGGGATNTLDSIRVLPHKFFDPTADDWNHKCAGSQTLSQGWNTIACEPKLVGSAVGLYLSPAVNFPICELRVFGTSGPPAPQWFNVSGGCPTLEGSYNISGTHDGLPEYKGGTGKGLLQFFETHQRWVFRESASDDIYAEAVSAGSLPEILWNAAGSGVAVNCIPQIEFEPEDACLWLFGAAGSVDNQYRCADGTMVSGSDDCEAHGNLAFCPPNLPVMCQTPSDNLGYAQYSCEETEADCGANGLRRCHDSVRAGTCTPSSKKSCLGSLQTVSPVDIKTAGEYVMHFACIDSLGQSVSKYRTVIVGCEGPNPTGFFGGNQIDCDTELHDANVLYNASDSTQCAEFCLTDANCEAFEFDNVAVTCRKWKTCYGTYSQDLVLSREVGYCARVDQPPTVVLAVADCCVNVGDVWPEASYGCEDAEDAFEPAMTRVSYLDVDMPGVYEIVYTCTDLAQNTDTKRRNVTVKANCPVPVVANSDHACQETDGAGVYLTEIPHGSTCTTLCNGQLDDEVGDSGKFFPSKLEINCVTTGDMDYQSQWDSVFQCGPFPCESPPVSNTITYACKEGKLFTGQCTPNCECNVGTVADMRMAKLRTHGNKLD
ncbi:unnamed protein product, partial [Prorocentrum cordatum]